MNKIIKYLMYFPRLIISCDIPVRLWYRILTRDIKINHPIGIIIGEGVQIGKNVTIYQNTTLGRKHEKSTAYPRILDNATIYANCLIIGDVEIEGKVPCGTIKIS